MQETFSKTKTKTHSGPKEAYWPWNNFSKEEMACKCCGKCDMDHEFMDKLQALREEIGVKLKVTSGYRCPEHNKKVSSSGKFGPHTTGKAVDLQVSGLVAFRILFHAPRMGFTGLGLQQKGLHNSRFIHLDTLQGSKNRPRPTVWTY